MTSLFQSFSVGDLLLPNRILMAPMTRSRADTDGCPSDLAVTYYAQRAGAGLIITEGTQPSPSGQGYPRTPGLHNAAQVAAWRTVADAVHDAGGRIFVQLMHAGRVAHPLNMAEGAEIVAPSSVAAQTMVFTDQQGPLAPPMPRALEEREIAEVVEEFARSARLAREAGLDGVELHAGSGYLPMQFLSPNANRRTDRYGGSPLNRCRFVVEVLEAMIGEIGRGRVGIKLSPGITFNDVHDDNAVDSYDVLLKALDSLQPAYVHVQRPARFLAEAMPGTDFTNDWVAFTRSCFSGAVAAGGDFDAVSAERALTSGSMDLVAFGRSFIANPDLPRRLELGAPVAEPDAQTFYTPGPGGYIDYPALANE